MVASAISCCYPMLKEKLIKFTVELNSQSLPSDEPSLPKYLQCSQTWFLPSGMERTSVGQQQIRRLTLKPGTLRLQITWPLRLFKSWTSGSPEEDDSLQE